MLTLTNPHGHEVTIDLGELGCVQGMVWEKLSSGPMPVENAEVTVRNLSNWETATETTDGKGRYEIDVNASRGDHVFVRAQWQSPEGGGHVASGEVTLAAAETGKDLDGLGHPCIVGATYLDRQGSGSPLEMVTIVPDVMLPGSRLLTVGRFYTVTIRHTLHVYNAGHEIAQNSLRMEVDFPGVMIGPRSWRKNVFVRSGRTKIFTYSTTVRGVTPKSAGEFDLIGRTAFFDKRNEKKQGFRIEK